MRKWVPLVTVCLGTFMLLVDVTIVNVALPDMATELRTTLSSLQWVVDGYALALAALLIGIGGLADRLGHRRINLAGLAVFALASLTCGLAPNVATLVVARVVQGIGGAGMIATTFALLNSAYTGPDRGIAYGMWGAVTGASSAIGPLLGGPLTEYLSWRWIFFVNLPVSVAALGLGAVVLRDRASAHRRRVDVTGVVVFSAAIGGLCFGMIRASEDGWGSWNCWWPLTIGALLIVVFVVVEARVAEPLLELALLGNRVFSGVLMASLLLNFAAYVSMTYASIWMQSVLALSPVTAGLVALPMSAAAFVVSAAFGRVVHRMRAGRIIGYGLALVGAGDLLGFGLVRAEHSWLALLPGFLVVGIGVGLSAPLLSSTGTAAVPAERGGMAGGALYTARQLGFAFGIALLGSVFTAGARHTLTVRHVHAAATAAHEVAGARSAGLLRSVAPGARAGLDQAIRAAAVNGFGLLLGVAGLVGLLGAVAAFTLIRSEPS